MPGRLELSRATANDVDELGRICYEAFKDIADRHGFEPDFPSARSGRRVVGMLVEREDFYGVAARYDGQLAGSNYLSLCDEVAGVGPISVEVPLQNEGIGRALMEDVIGYAQRRGIEKVRLLQDGFHMRSLALYASLGFEVKEAVAVMSVPAGGSPDGSVRPVKDEDLEAVDVLTRQHHRSSRRNEVAIAITSGWRPLLRERNGAVTGYFVPGKFGSGAAESEEDALALISTAAAMSERAATELLCPLSEGGLFRELLASGARVEKVMNLMALGPWEVPQAVWMPSVLY